MNELFRFFGSRVPLLAALSSVVILVACDEEPECTGNSQCALDQICQASRCIPRPVSVSRPIYCDGGTEICAPDAANSNPIRDSGVNSSDSGTPAGADAGNGARDGSSSSSPDGASGQADGGGSSPGSDGGSGSPRYDGGPLPIIDGGPGFDSGVSPPLTLASTGHVWLAEFSRSASTGGYMYDRSGGNYSETVQTFAVSSGSCRVRTRRALSGAATGIPLRKMQIDFTDNPVIQGSVELTSVNNDGYFQSTMPLPMPPLFTPGEQVRFQLVGDPQQVTSLADLEVQIDSPPVPAVTLPPSGTNTFSIGANPMITWNKAFGSANRTIYVELADFARDTLLTCEVDDTARQVRIPAAALRAWSLEGPAAPVQLEIRYDNRETRTVTTNSGLPVEITFRASAGRSLALVP